MRLGSGRSGSWRASRANTDQVTAALTAATAALSRAVESKDPSRVSVLRVLLQGQDAISDAESSQLAFSPSKSFVEAAKQLALAALWCNIRLGARGGPIRRRALDCIRRAGNLAGSFTLLQILGDLQEYISRRDAAEIAGSTETSTDHTAAAATVMGELVRGVYHLSREDASDAVMFLLDVLAGQSQTAKEEATAAAASIVMNFNVEEKVIARAAEWALAEASNIGANAAVLAVSVAGLLDQKTATDDFARACAKTFADLADTELEVKLWAIAMAKATVTSIAQEMPSGMKKARVADREYQEAMARLIRAGGIKQARIDSHWPLVSVLHLWRKRMQYGAGFIRLAIETLAQHLEDYSGLELGSETIYVGLIHGARPSVLVSVLPVLVGILAVDPVTQYEENTPYTNSMTGLGLAAAVEVLRQLGPDATNVMSEKQTGTISKPATTEVPACEQLLDAARRALQSEIAFIQEGGATLLAALASVSPLSRASILTETIQNLRLADLELANNPTGDEETFVKTEKKGVNKKELQKVSGYSLAIALLVDEATSYPGVPSALLDQCVDDAQALLKPHAVSQGTSHPIITARRRRSGWTLLTALGRSGLATCFSDERMPTLVPEWIDEISLVEASSASEENNTPSSEVKKRQDPPQYLKAELAAARTAALAALHSCIQSVRTREFELVAMALCGSAASRIAELDPGPARDRLLPELRRILVCVEALPPAGPSKDICFHLALIAEAEAIKRRKKILKAQKKTKGRRGSKSTKDRVREKLQRNQNNIITLFNSENSQNLKSDELMRVSAGALASLTSVDPEESADFLQDIAAKKLDVSGQFIGEVCLQMIRKLKPASLIAEPRIMATMQVLLRRAILSDVHGIKKDLAPPTTFQYLFGRVQSEERPGDLFVHQYTIQTVAEAYRHLGRKGGISLWSGLVDNVSDMMCKAVEGDPHIAVASASILGFLLSTPTTAIHGSRNADPGAIEAVSIRGAEALSKALDEGSVQVQVAAAASMSRHCVGIAERGERLLPLLLNAMLFEKGTNDVLVYLNDNDLTAARVDPEGSGDNLAAVGDGTAALLLALNGLRWWKIGESIQESTREIAVELVSWKVDRAPRTRAAGLTCIAGTWAAMNASLKSSANTVSQSITSNLSSTRSNIPPLLPFDAFWSSELPASLGRTAICETLMYRGGSDISEARYAAVSAVMEILQGAGPVSVLETFVEIPEALFVAYESGCSNAISALELLAAADAPGRFGFWLQLCRNVFYGGLLGVRTSGAGGRFESDNNSDIEESNKEAQPAQPIQPGAPAREQVKYARWQGDHTTRGAAVRVLRISVEAAVGSASLHRPDHINDKEASRKKANSWMEERLVEHLGRVFQVALTACSTSEACPGAAAEGALILKTVVPAFAKASNPESGGGLHLMRGQTTQISSCIYRLLVTPQMPEVVQAAALAASSFILSGCKVENLGGEKLLQALFGNQIHRLHKRFQYDILTEQAGAKTTVAVISAISMVVSEAIRNTYKDLLNQLFPYFPSLYRLCLAFLGDFASMFGTGPVDVAVNGGALTVAGASVDLIRSIFVKNAADIIFAACLMGPQLAKDGLAPSPNAIEWVCESSPGAFMASQPADRLFNSETRDMLLSGCVWWITVGLTKSSDQAPKRGGERRDVLERCISALQALHNWPEVEANVDGFTEALISLSAVDLAASSALAARLLTQKVPKTVLPPDPIGEGAMSVCLLALEQVAVFSQRDFARRDLPVAALDGITHLVRISHATDASLEGVVFPGLHGLFSVLENPVMDLNSRLALKLPATRFLSSIVATFIGEKSEHCLAAARRLAVLITGRSREGIETPQTVSIHVGLLCSMALASREAESPRMLEIEFIALQIIHFVLSSSQNTFSDAVLSCREACELLLGFFGPGPQIGKHSAILAKIWSRIGDLALREHPNVTSGRSEAPTPEAGIRSTEAGDPSMAVQLMLLGHKLCIDGQQAMATQASSNSTTYLVQMGDALLSLVIAVLLGRIHTPRGRGALESLAQLVALDASGVKMMVKHYIGERRDLLDDLLSKS